MNKKIINIDESTYRLVVISDVHGHKEALQSLLKKTGIKDEDYLIILGDFLNRGIDSVEMLAYIKTLQNRDKTIILKGNHESFMQRHIAENNYSQAFYEFLKADYYETLIGTLIKKKGRTANQLEGYEEMLRLVADASADVTSFLSSLPIILNFDEFRFVHGGYDPSFSIDGDETQYLKYDHYNTMAKPNDKVTIVGHWPASELRGDKLTNLPYHNTEKNIIFIDGGLGVKHTGELNAFIIEKKDNVLEYDLIQHNTFEKRTIVKAHAFEEESLVYLYYPDQAFEVIQHGQPLSKCRHIKSGKLFSIITDLLKKGENGWETRTNYINNFLNLEVGTPVELCRFFGDYALVKHQDVFGWVLKYQLD